MLEDDGNLSDPPAKRRNQGREDQSHGAGGEEEASLAAMPYLLAEYAEEEDNALPAGIASEEEDEKDETGLASDASQEKETHPQNNDQVGGERKDSKDDADNGQAEDRRADSAASGTTVSAPGTAQAKPQTADSSAETTMPTTAAASSTQAMPTPAAATASVAQAVPPPAATPTASAMATAGPRTIPAEAPPNAQVTNSDKERLVIFLAGQGGSRLGS